MRPAVFLDRDGTLIHEAEYLKDPAGVEVLPGTAAGLRDLRAAGYALVVTSNQSGVARGYFDEDTVRRVNGRVRELLNAQGADVDAVYYCPHYAKGTMPEYARECDCRKPAPGMILTAARDLNLDLERSWVVGDKAADVAFGKNLKLKTVLVLTGYGAKTQAQGFAPGAEPDIVSPDVATAAQAIIRFGQAPEMPKRWGLKRKAMPDDCEDEGL
jgi:D-glycero-D-manno-heptose 1,7-bisphosphate phosphatase